jgi:carbonic anhydrase/acetyltransferase-like protein (isoleucine patch superfamily)
MADVAERPADRPDSEQGSNVVPMPGVEMPGAGLRRTEGGLSLNFSFDIPKLPKLHALPTWTHQQLINGGLIVAVALLGAFIAYSQFTGGGTTAEAPKEATTGLVRPNVATDFNPSVDTPRLAPTTYVDRLASVIGDVVIGERVFVAPFASIRGDEGQPIVIGDNSNVQDMVVVHALETFEKGKVIDKNLVTVDGKRYAVFIGTGVSLAHQSQVHGPAAVGDHTFVGMQALVFRSTIGKNVVIEPGAKVIGVVIADGRYVPAGAVVTTQQQADTLPKITSDYAYATLNDGVLHVNEAFADAYAAAASGKAEAPAP